MVKDVSISHTFKHSFSLISLASWLKYPTETRPDVLCVDLLDYKYDPEKQRLFTKRLLTMKPILPSWFSGFFGIPSGHTYCIEEAEVDVNNNKMILEGRNLTMNNIMELRERCTYTRHPDNTEWTHFSHEARAVAFPWFFKEKLEDWTLDRFLQNAARGRDLMETTCQTIKKYGLDAMLDIKASLNDARNMLKEEADQILETVEKNVQDIKSGQVDQIKRTIRNL